MHLIYVIWFVFLVVLRVSSSFPIALVVRFSESICFLVVQLSESFPCCPAFQAISFQLFEPVVVSFLLQFNDVLAMVLLAMLAMVLLTMASCSLGTIEPYSRSNAICALPYCTSVELSAYSSQCSNVLLHPNILSRCWLPDDQSLTNPLFLLRFR